MSRSSLRVGRSRTGLGLFATRPIKKRTIFIEYRGRRITNAEAEELEKRGSRYMYELNSRWTIDGSSRRNIARYANHSCRPNAESDVLLGKRAEGRKGGKAVLRAIKNIEPGDEITYDYGKDYWNAYIKPIGCKCDSCRRKRAKQRAEARLKRLRRERRAAAKVASKAAKSRAKSRTAPRVRTAGKTNGKTNGKATSKTNGKAARRGTTRRRVAR